MTTPAAAPFLHAAAAARRLGVSTKALRLYEQCGLLRPARNAAGWRLYGPREMACATQIAALRRLGVPLAQVGAMLDGGPQGLQPALAAHEASLQQRLQRIASTLDEVRSLRTGAVPEGGAVSQGVLTLPWPWAGEALALRALQPLTFLVGPLGSGKTRLAVRLAEVLPGARFLGLGRVADGAAAARMPAGTALHARVLRAVRQLADDGAAMSDALCALLAGLEDECPGARVVDLVEHGLDDAATQRALAAYLRRRATAARPLVVMTRSSVVLDLQAVGPDVAILFCPANHSPPVFVTPRAGAPGYEALASCLAPPEVRARTRGMAAWLPQATAAT